MRPNKRLMLVDDDEDDREIFLSVVQSIAPAATTTAAINGKDALERLRRSDSLPDMVFLDLNMPLMDGRQFLQEIKKDSALKDIPVIVLTTSSDKDTIHSVKTLGAHDFVTKPDQYSGWEKVLRTYLTP